MRFKLGKVIKYKGLFISLILNFILVIFILMVDFKKFDNVSSEDYIILGNVREISRIDMDKLRNFNSCNKGMENYLFLGDSITYRYNLDKYFSGVSTVNSGIDGNTASDILHNMKERVYRYNPTTIFLLIGTNQLDGKQTNDEIIQDIQTIVEQIQINRPLATIYIESIYPVNDNVENNDVKWRTNSRIMDINTKIKEYAMSHNVYYIDLYSSLIDKVGNLNSEYTLDGLHLNDAGYEVVTTVLLKYIKEC